MFFKWTISAVQFCLENPDFPELRPTGRIKVAQYNGDRHNLLLQQEANWEIEFTLRELSFHARFRQLQIDLIDYELQIQNVRPSELILRGDRLLPCHVVDYSLMCGPGNPTALARILIDESRMLQTEIIRAPLEANNLPGTNRLGWQEITFFQMILTTPFLQLQGPLSNLTSFPRDCCNCKDFHGKAYYGEKGYNPLICAIHPYGYQGESCADFSPIPID